MQKNKIRLLIFFLTLSIGLGVYFAAVQYSIQEVHPSAGNTPFDLVSSEIENETSESDFYHISFCTDANKFKEYKYPRKSPTVSRGFLNGLVLCGALPEYFPTTKNDDTSVIVKVDVFIDEAGEVIKAHAANDNSLLRQQVEKAVYQTRFCPTLLGGESMKVKGVLVYQFDSERGFWLPKRFSETELYLMNHSSRPRNINSDKFQK